MQSEWRGTAVYESPAEGDKWGTARFVAPLREPKQLEEESSNKESYLDNVNSFGAFQDHGCNKFWEIREPSKWNLHKPMNEFFKLAQSTSEETYLLDAGATCPVTNSEEYLEDVMPAI